MQIEVIGDLGPQRTDTPDEVTPEEVTAVRQADRLVGIKLHVAWTGSTLGVATDASLPTVGRLRPSTCTQSHGDPCERRSRRQVGIVLLRRPVRQGHPQSADGGFFSRGPQSCFGLV